MSRISEEKREVLAFIDAIVTMLENASLNELKLPDINSLTISINPFDFLLSIITKFVSYEEMVEWLTKFLTYVMPIVEIGVKGVLLSNLKQSIDCNNDPRIPNSMRDSGMTVSLSSIDYKNMLSVSPMTPYGQTMYFGTNNIDNIYELVRAQDFNAFLWFVVNKARFIVSQNNYSGNTFECGVKVEENVKYSNYSPGYVIGNGNSLSNLLLCTKVYSVGQEDVSNSNEFVNQVTSNKENITSTFVSIGNNLTGCNWYVNSGTYFQYLKTPSERVERDYNNDKAICSITFKSALKNGMFLGLPSNVINFRILPKPLVNIGGMHVNKADKSVSIEPFKRILFDKDGTPNFNGKYTVKPKGEYVDKTNKKTYYYLDSKTDSKDKIILNWENGTYEFSGTKNSITYYLIECYPNLTVYEFNYDYVMGMQLFEPKVVASQLIENVCHIGNIGFSINKTESLYKQKISEIVKKIVESTEYTASDCFYTFSNEKYESMLYESELKRSQLYEFNDSTSNTISLTTEEVYDLLNQFNDDASLVENQEVIRSAFLRASEILSNSTDNEDDKYNIKIGFINDIISSLVTIIVETLLTPKIVLLLKVNHELMGGTNDLSFEDFLAALGGLITAIVKEIRDMILNEILKWALQILKDLAEKLAALLLKEQIEYYTRLMKLLLKACMFRRKLEDVQIDNVDYADIDEPTEQPINNEC